MDSNSNKISKGFNNLPNKLSLLDKILKFCGFTLVTCRM